MARPSSKLTIVAALAPVFLVACGTGSTGSGSTGDAPSEPEANALGTCSRLSEVLTEARWLEPSNSMSQNCDPPANTRVCISGVTVVAIDKFDETGAGAFGNYYVQDALAEPEPYTGVTVFAPSFSPPDLRLGVGDVTDILGTYMEFLGPSVSPFGQCRTLPEVTGAMSMRFEGSSPKPLTIPLNELLTYESARRYIGMLVRVDEVEVTSISESGGRYTANLKVNVPISPKDVPRLSNDLFDLGGIGLKQGDKIRAVTGVLTYFYGFKISPRSAEDLES